MKNSSFDQWLKGQFVKTSDSFDKDQEWELLLPKISKKKSKRRLLFWFLFPILITGAGISYWSLRNKALVIRNDINELSDSKTNYNNKSIAEASPIALNTTSTESAKALPKVSVLNTSYFNSGKIQEQNSELLESITTQVGLSERFNYKTSLLAERNVINRINSENDLTGTPILISPIGQRSLEQPVSSNLKSVQACPLEIVTSTKVKIAKQNILLPLSVMPYASYGRLNQNLDGKNELATSRQNSEKGLDVFITGINIQTSFKNKLRLGIGVEYNHSSTLFSQKFMDTIIVEKHGSVTLEKINGSSQLIKDTGTVSVKQFRDVSRIHYNHRNQLAIPLNLSYPFRIDDQWKFLPSFGIIVPIYTQFNGTILKTDLYGLELNKYGQNIDKSKIPCSVSMGLLVEYCMNPFIQIQFGLGNRRELGVSKDLKTSMKERYSSLSLQTGIVFKLN